MSSSNQPETLERQDLSCTNLAHHELESIFIVIISQTFCGFTSEELTKADALIDRACVSPRGAAQVLTSAFYISQFCTLHSQDRASTKPQ